MPKKCVLQNRYNVLFSPREKFQDSGGKKFRTCPTERANLICIFCLVSLDDVQIGEGEPRIIRDFAVLSCVLHLLEVWHQNKV